MRGQSSAFSPVCSSNDVTDFKYAQWIKDKQNYQTNQVNV